MSGFFFCGIIEEPVAKASSKFINENSDVHQIIISSENLDRCIEITEIIIPSSIIKSLSLTESKLFSVGLENPSSFATKCLSKLKVVPASAPAPSGISSLLSKKSSILVMSLLNIWK